MTYAGKIVALYLTAGHRLSWSDNYLYTHSLMFTVDFTQTGVSAAIKLNDQ